MTDGNYRLKRRQLLQLGIGGVSAVAAGLPLAAVGNQPGSGQGPPPPQPPPPTAVVDFAAHDRRGLDRALDLAAVGVARSTAGIERRRQLAPAAGNLAGKPLHAALQLQRLEPWSHDSHARRRNASRHAEKPSGSESESRPERDRAPDPFEVHPDVLAAAFCRMQKAAGQSCDAPPDAATLFGHFHEFFEGIPMELVDTSCVAGHVNVPHGSHTTNLHTHGLHVEPGFNANGTAGDNTYLRVLPRADGQTRKSSSAPGCQTLEPMSASPKRTMNIRWVTCSGRAGGQTTTAAAPARHPLVSPPRARLDARPGGERPRRVPHHRRGRRRRDQPRDDGNRASGPMRQDRPVRLSRAPDAHPARRSLLRRRRCRATARAGPNSAAHRGEREFHADDDLHATRRGRTLACAQRERRWPRIQVVHGARGALCVLRPSTVAGSARRKSLERRHGSSRRRDKTSPTRPSSCFSCRSTASRWSRSRMAAPAIPSAIWRARTRERATRSIASPLPAKTRRARC